MKKIPITLGLILIGIVSALSQAQQTVIVSGGDISGLGGSLSYSIGQITYNEHVGNTGSSTQGMQQAFEISVVGVKSPEFDHALSVFPNPVKTQLILQVKDYDTADLTYQLIDVQGNLLMNEKVLAPRSEILMNN